jgi:cytochrome b-561 domain-containing protein 2
MVVHVITVGLTAALLYLASPGSDLFSWHPSLMVVAFGLFMAQAIVIFSPESSLLLTSSRQDKVQLHW